eukprot:NODE_16654_length_984_cov_4.256709.p1 GENE.NODE_16654_length_984_cov_4.256709~~NODE_16654_length_984_cov_4.256709.p1  ORF type:complete len:244 (+),score=50.66 NODE_16654_length_984_cov_4.256709:133-864(+)
MAYFERQRQALCALHAINNLLQLPPDAEGHFGKAEADRIAVELYATELASLFEHTSSRARRLRARVLGWFSSNLLCCNPLRSLVPCKGDYDLQVMLTALDRRGYCAVSHHVCGRVHELHAPRIRSEVHEELAAGGGARALVGLIVSQPSRIFTGRHWLCYVPFGHCGAWLCLDSERRAPLELGGDDDGATMGVRAAAELVPEPVFEHLRARLCQWQLPSCLLCGLVKRRPLHILAVCSKGSQP